MQRIISRMFFFISLAFVLMGLFTLLVFSTLDVTTIFFFVASAIFFILFVLLDFKHLIGKFKNRTARWSGIEVLKALSLMGVVLSLNALAAKYPVKWDVSPHRVHTLSALSKKVAKEFNDTVEFSYFYVPSSEKKDLEDQVSLIVQKYQDENPKIRLKKINVLKNPAEAQAFGLLNQEEGFFVTYKERRERFFKSDESSMTQALIRLTKGRKTIYFSQGFGEGSLEEKKGRGYSDLAKELDRLFFRVDTIQLDTEVLPEDAAALVITGAERPFTEKVQNKIVDFVDKGGRVLLALDPMVDPQEQLLRRFDLAVKKGVVHMDENELTGSGSHLVSGILVRDKLSFLQHVDNESVALFYITSALQIIKTDRFTITPLIVSPESAVLRSGFTNKDRDLEKGAFALLNMAQEGEKPGRLLVSGDADLFSNQFLYQHLNPSIMFMVFNYLSNEEQFLIAPPKKTNEKFLVTETMYKLYLAFFIIPIPIFFFAMASFLALRRRWL